MRGGGEPQAGGEPGLVIEGETVVASLRQQMQMDAQRRQGAFLARDAPRLGLGQQPRACDAVPAAGDAAGLRQPVNHVQIAQAARAVLEVGFELVGAVVEAGVARLLLGEFAVEKVLRAEACLEAAFEFLEQRTAAPQESRFEQIGLDRDVGVGLADAGLDGTHAVADFQPDVPACLHPAFQRGPLSAGGLVRQQQQHVHVRTGEQFVAPVAADGGKAEAGGQREPDADFRQHAVHQGGVARQVVGGDGFFKIGRSQRRAAGFEPLAQIGERRDAHAAWRTRSGIAGVPAETVSTS